MSYVPGCNVDVFISYAHNDNKDGWITRLKERLTEKLSPFLAGRVEVWFDDRIRPGVYFQEEIQELLKNTPIFLAVISPSYLNSDFCMIQELEWFQNRGGKDILQLLKVPLETGQDLPIPTSDYTIMYDKSDGHLFQGDALEKRLDKVVNALKEQLRGFWDLRPKIYVAQLRHPETKLRWDALKEGLHGEGFAVLPRGVLQARVPDARIREWLEGARLSVHLSNVQNDPLAEKQLEIAKLIGKPMLMLPTPPAPDQVPEVIAQVQKQLEAVRKPSVYFIYDYYSDGSRVSSLTGLIGTKTGCEVFLPEAGEKYHKFRLRVSDGVLLFRSDAPEDWLRSQELALLQAAALRERPIPEAKYFTRKSNGHPAGVNSRQGPRHEWIIERSGEPNIDDLEPFVNALRLAMNAGKSL
jgi:TIR domain-containing protein